jgi:outer membrane protein OmpA-like peptidoglycan-associated protein
MNQELTVSTSGTSYGVGDIALMLLGYVPTSHVVCAFKNDTSPTGDDWLGVLGHSLVNALVIGGASKLAGMETKKAVMVGVGGSVGVYAALFGYALYRESCKVEVVVTPKKIEVSQQIFFDYDKATIKPVSFSVIDEVYAVLVENPTVTIEIQGHTDNQGKPDYNLKLSQDRADSVRKYLLKKGIESSRLTAKGYGMTMPIESNDSEAGRSKNRRVEFVRTDKALEAPSINVSGMVSPEF